MRARVAMLALLAIATGCDRRRRVGEGAYAETVHDAIPKIEQATGLKYKSPPKLELRSREQVRQFLLRNLDEETPASELRGEEQALKLFGLIPDTLNLRPFLIDLLTEQIIGYYDPATKVLYVVREAPEDLASLTVTHELVHALQDQYVNLDSIEKDHHNSDRTDAAKAVLEGQAVYIQMQVMLGSDLATRLPGGSEQMRQQIRENQSSMPKFANAPMAIQESLIFPYLSGWDFIRRFNQHFPRKSPLGDLPVSTEQILSEKAYFGTPRDMPTDVILPAVRDSSAYEETMGEFGTRLFLYQHLKDNTVAVGAAAGWDGDRYRVVRAGKGLGIVWVSVWDTPFDEAQFVDALGQAIGKRYNTAAPSLSGTGARTYTGSGRTVVITPRAIKGRSIVVYADVPAGASPALIDPARITLGQ